MRRTRFDDWSCPIARTTDLVGDWWTPLVMRQAFLGCRRFDDFQTTLGISRSVLTDRLSRLVDEGLLERRPYDDRPVRHEYRLTDKGRDFWGVLAAMWRWGQDWTPSDTDPVLVDRHTGERVVPAVVDGRTGVPLDPRSLSLRPADQPGATT